MDKAPRLPWIFIDGATQQTFRIRLDLPDWDPPTEGDKHDEALCAFHVIGDDGAAFALRLQISRDVLSDNAIADPGAFQALVQGKGVEIIEGAIHNGIRGDHRLVWETDGVSVVG